MIKLKNGTKVKIRQLEEMSDTDSGCGITEEMRRLSGKVLTIVDYSHWGLNSEGEKIPRYRLKGGKGWTYTPELFDVYVPKNVIGGKLL
ncbi:hypothetical protein QUF70_21995 [Desulfobacterales bacterium HSG17]|nr:hypothetical protein [Desulfobacterales bacterium HSG17]